MLQPLDPQDGAPACHLGSINLVAVFPLIRAAFSRGSGFVLRPKPEIVELDWGRRARGLANASDLTSILPTATSGESKGCPGSSCGVVSLVRLLGERGRAKQARNLLALVCPLFTRVFHTPDLIEARMLH